MYQSIYLKKKEEGRIHGGHVWVYSNEIDTKRSPLKAFEQGQIARLCSHQDKPLGLVYVNPHSLICARVLTRDVEQAIDLEFFTSKLQAALDKRARFYDKPFYRWVFGESDMLPGLVVDRFDNNIVVQCNTSGIEAQKALVIEAIKTLIDGANIYWRADSSIRQQEGAELYSEMVAGTWPEQLEVVENGVSFLVDAEHGQKTGWFYDHRDNRRYLQSLSQDKSVLDVFCYVGGWGLQALAAGAKHATFIDASQSACDLVQANAERQGVADKIDCITSDAFSAMQALIDKGARFDIVVVDPPAFIKRKKDTPKGQKAYQKLNYLAAQLVSEKGLLVSASCSMHWGRDRLIDSARKAASKTQRPMQLNAMFAQAADHPIHPAITETEYLKAGFFSLD